MYEKRIIATGVSLYLVGIILITKIGITNSGLCCAIFSVLFAVACVFCFVSSRLKDKKLKKHLTATAFAVAALFLGVLRVSIYNNFAESNSVYDKQSDSVILKIEDVNTTSLDCKILSSDLGVENGEKLRLYCSDKTENYIMGDYISAEIVYSYRDDITLYTNDIVLSAYGKIKDYAEGRGIFYSIRKSISDNSGVLYSKFENAPAISKAVTVGDRSDMSSYIFSLYRNAGISHILAISGLHLSIVSMSIFNFFIAISAGRKIGGFVASAFAIAYAILVGLTPGVVRSAVMLCFYMIPRVFFRDFDRYTSLFLALFVLCFNNPYAIYSAGLQLSFICSLGIILSAFYISRIGGFFSRRKYGKPRYKVKFYNLCEGIVSTSATSFAASVFSFPILLLSFDTVSYCSPIVNILAIPLFSFAVTLSVIAFLVAPISLVIAKIIAFPAGFAFEIVTFIAKAIFNMDVGVISSYAPLMFIPLLFSFLMIFSLIFLAKKREKMFYLSSLLFVLSFAFCGITNGISFYDRSIIEYGNAKSEYLLVTSENNAIYADLGGYISNPTAVYKNRLTSIDSYVILKYDSYTLKRFDYMTGTMKVSRLYLPLPNKNDNIDLNSIKELANQRNCDIIYFTDYFEDTSLPFSDIKVFRELENGEETIICINVNGKKFRVLTNGYDKAVNCDVALITDEYNGDFSNMKFEECYITDTYYEKNANASRYCTAVDALFKIVIDISESDYTVYEP